MANLPETEEWVAGIYQLETTDPVMGGADGIDNQQAKQLLARLNWLRALVESMDGGAQPLDATLTALAGLAIAADKLIYATGEDAFATTALSAFIRTLLGNADAATARATLAAAGLGVNVFTGAQTFGAGVFGAAQALAAADIDLSIGEHFAKTATGNLTLTVSDVPATGIFAGFLLELTNGGLYTIAYPAGTVWLKGSAPLLATAGTDIMGFYTVDGGAIWNATYRGRRS